MISGFKTQFEKMFKPVRVVATILLFVRLDPSFGPQRLCDPSND